jgi:hypothetical protein
MADIQRQFEKFHEIIRVDFDMQDELREKRDVVVGLIIDHLRERGLPTPEPLLQGSYRMGTGVKPIAELEYDIDIGLRFAFGQNEFRVDEVKQWIFEAVEGHTKRTEDKGPCVRVLYAAGFHLDLVAYRTYEGLFGGQKFQLAHKTRGWVDADPPALLEHVEKHRGPFSELKDSSTKTDQFRRVVRYLRRWNDVRLPREDDGKPTGLSLVLLCCEKLRPHRFLDGRPNDLKALAEVARAAGASWGRISARKPTPEYEDMFGRLDDNQMAALKHDLVTLSDALDEAAAMADPVEACRRVSQQLGNDFPIPAPEETARRSKAPAIVTSSASA